MSSKIWNKCDYCGRFISFKDFESGPAIIKYISDDTEFTKEEIEVICKKCNKREKKYCQQYNYSQGLPL